MTIPNQKKERVWNDPPMPGEKIVLTPEQKDDLTRLRNGTEFIVYAVVGIYSLLYSGFVYFMLKFNSPTPEELLVASLLVPVGFIILSVYKRRKLII